MFKTYFHVPDGGYAIHKITGSYRGAVSAWFDKRGNLIDCEQILNSGVSRPIKKDAPLWRYVAAFGKRHLYTPALN